jgi:hypothetical protein
MYTCRRDTTFMSQHINTQHDRHGGRGRVHTVRTSCATWRAPLPEWSMQRPLWSSVGGQLHSVVFVRTQVAWGTPTRKIPEASSPGNSRAMGWAHHGRASDCCMCRLKTSALWEPSVAQHRRVGRWLCPGPRLVSVVGAQTLGACLGNWKREQFPPQKWTGRTLCHGSLHTTRSF